MKTCNKTDCDRNQFGGGYCKYHQYMREDKPKTLMSTTIHDKSINKSIKKKRASPTGELALFKSIWNERPHVSELSGKQLGIFDIHCFHHILTKGAYPEHRLNKENIVMLTRNEHNAAHQYSWQQLIAIDSRWQTILDKYLNLKEYVEQQETKE
jgi:hypothetical protein